MEWKPRRSSLKLSTEPITDDSVVDRPSTRRVSFARVISICGGEQSETQLSLGGSDEFTEVTKPCESLSTIRDMPMDETSDLSMTIDGNVCVAKPISSNDFNSVALLPRLEETWIMSPSTMNESAVTVFPSSPGGPPLLPTKNTCVNETSGSISASDDMSVDEQQLSDVTLPDSHTPIKVKGTVITSDAVNTPSMSPSTPYVCSETKRASSMHFSNGPQCQSLPPLQRHPNLSVVGMSVLSTSKLCSTESKQHAYALSNKSSVRDGHKLLTESLATTPLRQVIPRDWIHAVQLSVSRSTCGTFSRRLDPNHLIPREKCRRSHLLSVSDHPCYTSPPRGFGLTTKSLEEFLEQHQCVLLDEEDVLEATFPGNLDALKQFQPELYVEFSKKRKAVQQIFDANIKHYINEWKLRRSGVLFSHSSSLPVVEQLSKMTDSQVRICYIVT
ncbi:hypothetical protein PHET_10019 [Paragonimus heterotremus]|uniref:Uncharacterized protein n=1 Tax=Paragonimus heterotremus TaxID=100268 RepID=A0A8J4TAI4_9TREM|nr:hypothetical protein PHET_10019 [Paragonimus heterotremus]